MFWHWTLFSCHVEIWIPPFPVARQVLIFRIVEGSKGVQRFTPLQWLSIVGTMFFVYDTKSLGEPCNSPLVIAGVEYSLLKKNHYTTNKGAQHILFSLKIQIYSKLSHDFWSLVNIEK